MGVDETKAAQSSGTTPIRREVRKENRSRVSHHYVTNVPLPINKQSDLAINITRHFCERTPQLRRNYAIRTDASVTQLFEAP